MIRCRRAGQSSLALNECIELFNAIHEGIIDTIGSIMHRIPNLKENLMDNAHQACHIETTLVPY